ncbi:MAG: FtsX-like permease family protein [Bacteroidales bacterium]|nr:FtsX-like permease family protein [Bacteroidales bacterium]
MNRFKDTLIKILSLGIGLAIGIVLIAKVCFELSYDSFYKDVDRIYLIKADWVMGDQHNDGNRISGAVAPGFKAEVPGVEEATRIVLGSRIINYVDEEGNIVYKGKAIIADTSFFKVFSQPILAGDIVKALNNKESLAISRSFAEKLGGINESIGKLISQENNNTKYVVEAVFEDLPANGSFSFGVMFSLNIYQKESTENWVFNDMYTGYVKLQKGIDPHSLDEAIHKMQATHQDLEKLKTEEGYEVRYHLVPFDKLHTSDPDVRNTVIVLSIVAFLLIFISLMNYILVVLSSMVRRSKEIGIRKCFGAGGREIYEMLLKEAAIHIGLSLVLAALLILAGSNLITNLLGVSFTTMLVGKSMRTIAVVIVVIFVLSVVVPGLLYTRIPVWQAIRNFSINMRRWKLFLLSLQVAVNVFIVSMLLVVMGQYEFLANEDLGYNYKNLYYVDARTVKTRDLVVNKLNSMPEVEGVEACAILPYQFAEGNVVMKYPEMSTMILLADGYCVTDGFYDLMEIPFIAGSYPVDSSQVAISESLIEKMMEHEDWSDGAVGKKLYISDHSFFRVGNSVHIEPLTVSGVYRSIRVGSALDPNLKPSCYFHGDLYSGTNFDGVYFGKTSMHPMRYLLVKVNHANKATREKILDAIKEFAPDGEEMEVKSYAEEVRAQYADNRKMRNTILVGALFALLISLIGLIGYVSDEANRRSKEIAIRKVHGAVSGEIVGMFVGEVLKLSLVAAVVGAVGAFFVARKWIEQFAFRINLSPWYFVGAAVIVLVIVAIVIGVSSWRIARMNPVKSLKDE